MNIGPSFLLMIFMQRPWFTLACYAPTYFGLVTISLSVQYPLRVLSVRRGQSDSPIEAY